MFNRRHPRPHIAEGMATAALVGPWSADDMTSRFASALHMRSRRPWLKHLVLDRDRRAPHIGQRVVLRIDLREFYPSIRSSRVQGVFRTLGYPESVARLLTWRINTARKYKGPREKFLWMTRTFSCGE